MNIKYSFPNDNSFLKKVAKTYQIFSNKKDTKGNYTFINTNKCVDTTFVDDHDGKAGTIVITNRKKLANLFKLLANNENNHKYIICDIHLKHISKFDSLLQTELNRIDKIIFPFIGNRIETENNVSTPKSMPFVFGHNIVVGSAGSFTFGSDEIVKAAVFDNELNIKTIPVLVYEKINKKKLVENDLSLFECNGQIYPRHYFPKRYLDTTNDIQLEVLVSSLESPNKASAYKQYIDNKILIIGNFEKDKVIVDNNQIPGSLQIYNEYLNFENNNISMSWASFVWLFVFIYLITLTFVNQLAIIKFLKNKNPKIIKLLQIVRKNIDIKTILALASIVLFILFEMNLVIIIILIPLYFFNYIEKCFKLM